MKKRQLEELKTKTTKELESGLVQKRLELVRARAELATGRHKNKKVVKNLRRDIAQTLTVLAEKLGGQETRGGQK